ncbi:hypothetical protein JYU03_00255 [bacterium AH-315-F03]|nr:hypothetical protein [bacterium AH-315-F03]
MRLSAIAMIATIASSVTLLSCGGIENNTTISKGSYTLQGYIVGDMERDTSFIRVSFIRDGSMIPGGPITLDTFLLSFDLTDSLFKAEFGPSNTLSSSIYELTSFDGATEVSAENVTMVGGLTMNIISPADRVYTSADGSVVANLTSASLNSTDYAIAIVKAGEEYTGSGYADFFSLIDGAGIVPPEFFRDSLNNDSLLVGTYYLYMYSYSGSPQISSQTNDIPTVLPAGGFADNLSSANFSGKLGSIVVSRRDTLIVTDTP